jgi:hypothetical protein
MNLPPSEFGNLRNQGIIQFLNERLANLTLHGGHYDKLLYFCKG